MALVINTVTFVVRGVAAAELPQVEAFLKGRRGARVIQAQRVEVYAENDRLFLLVDGKLRRWTQS